MPALHLVSCRSGALAVSGHEAGSGADISLIDAYLQQLLPALAKSKATSKGVQAQSRKRRSTGSTSQPHRQAVLNSWLGIITTQQQQHYTASNNELHSMACRNVTAVCRCVHPTQSPAVVSRQFSCRHSCGQLGSAGPQQRCSAGCRTTPAHHQRTVQSYGSPCRCAGQQGGMLQGSPVLL
jgi:hypothetical protein